MCKNASNFIKQKLLFILQEKKNYNSLPQKSRVLSINMFKTKKIISKSDLNLPQIKEIQRHSFPSTFVVIWARFCHLCLLSAV